MRRYKELFGEDLRGKKKIMKFDSPPNELD